MLYRIRRSNNPLLRFGEKAVSATLSPRQVGTVRALALSERSLKAQSSREAELMLFRLQGPCILQRTKQRRLPLGSWYRQVPRAQKYRLRATSERERREPRFALL